MNYKIKGYIKDSNKIEIITETGHKIYFTLEPEILIDLRKREKNLPFFSVGFRAQYEKTVKDKKPMSVKSIEKMLKKRKIDNFWEEMEKQGY